MADIDDKRAEEVAAAGIPVVLVGRLKEPPASGAAVFALENYTVDLALSHLWRLGHRRIAHIAGPIEDSDAASSTTGRPEFASQIARDRLEYYSSWMAERGQYDPKLIVRAGSWFAGTGSARAALRKWRQQANAPTAVFCSSDSLAMDLIDAARAENVSVPEELSIIGVDNLRTGEHTVPALTTIELPAEDIGRAAMSLLLGMIDRQEFGSDAFGSDRASVAFPVTKIVVRESTGPLRNRQGMTGSADRRPVKPNSDVLEASLAHYAPISRDKLALSLQKG